ncbi:VWA domain-containing protein [Rhodopirellula sp. ICT_H3.1]|uniref:VWA domain-containing protein n=2 Tax=Aporhodopirellula aestuarii TaxID=2950107 RepID=A0ABT0UA34_9BACT|nr:VWA domain-containing protein [Aporhodopirellula aestuarii]MCM2373730.1 VWA domain-containing protein [Aporhodopirellula aestuarii]
MTGMLVIMIGMAAFAVDLTRMQLVRSQMQSAVDAAALAGSMQLRDDPKDVDAAKAAAEKFIHLNNVGFFGDVASDAIQVETGTWDSDTSTFVATTEGPCSVRVFATKSNELFSFAQIFGHLAFSMPGQSIASVPTSPLDIIMVLDLSGSMSSDGRIEALRAASPEFVTTIENAGKDDRIGVMCYGAEIGSYPYGNIYTQSPASLFPDPDEASTDWAGILEAEMTDNFAALRGGALSSSSLQSNKYGGGTPIGAAIRDGAHYLDANNRQDAKGRDLQKLMVLMSDGYANKPEEKSNDYALQMAKYAASLEIQIYTISLGDDADTELMSSIASKTGGRYFEVTGSDSELTAGLKRAYRGIANDINRVILVK